MSVRARRIGKRAGILAAFLGACPAALAAGGGEDVSHAAQFVWQAVNLLILAGVLVYFARKPIASFLVDRREKIRGDLDEAATWWWWRPIRRSWTPSPGWSTSAGSRIS